MVFFYLIGIQGGGAKLIFDSCSYINNIHSVYPRAGRVEIQEAFKGSCKKSDFFYYPPPLELSGHIFVGIYFFRASKKFLFLTARLP